MSAPTWFTETLASPVDTGTVQADGARIHYRAWGPDGAPGVVLVHGGAAHARWWDHVGPLLAVDRRVVAVDLSGHGDSDRRAKYSQTVWAREVMTVAEAALPSRPVVVGHSMGGMVTLSVAAMFGSRIDGAVVMDSPIRERVPEQQAVDLGRASRAARIYPRYNDIVQRFRPLPQDGPVVDFVAKHVAEHSVRPVDNGWSWKFDPRIFTSVMKTPSEVYPVDCRVALVRGDRGSVSVRMQEQVRDRLGPGVTTTVIPDAGHHIMLDAPLALVTCLRTLLAAWQVDLDRMQM